MLSARVGRLIAGKVAYGATCFGAALLIVVSGYAHKVVTMISETASGIAINGSTINGNVSNGSVSSGSTGNGGSSIGTMNLLVMGLESRTNYQGQELPEHLLTQMHSGSVGGQDTNTLILIHIFAGGQRAVGFSIPRDDLVKYPHATLDGITQGKIDQAYNYAYNESLDKTVGQAMSRSERYLKANQAGQAFEIATVQAVTGQHIDHFVEVNLAGFFYLAKAFGGIEVCVKPWTAGHDANLQDTNSGWNAVRDGYKRKKGGDQYLHLAADQALAYVRDRDSLPQGDLSRTNRQQAVIDYVIWELQHEGAFSDISKLNALLATASQYLITDSTFNLLDFATSMRALSGSNLTFRTLPIAGQRTGMPLNGTLQDVNLINVPYVKRLIAAAFNPKPPAKKSAAKKPAAKKPAAKSARGKPSATSSARASTASVSAAQLPAGPAASPASSPASTAGANNGQAGGTVTVGPKAKYGVPCVY